MKTTTYNLKAGQGMRAFTLVELLVVISIIGIIAAMSVGAIRSASMKRDQSAVEAQKAKLILALEDYKGKFGSYPPDNAAWASTNAHWNPLAYELGGMRRSGVDFLSESDLSHVVTRAMIASYFGLAVGQTVAETGLLNATPSPTVRGKSFLLLKGGSGKTADYVLITNGVPGMPPVMLLKVAAEHPTLSENVWRYRSYPANGHNPKSYDLWAEIKKSTGTTNTISNWK